jgi:putative protease
MELLLPAGSAEAFYAALEGGADAVYLGLDQFNARGRAKNFSRKEFLNCITLAHTKGVKVYLTLNTLVKNNELPALIELLSFVTQTGADAVIVQDWGVFYLIKKYFPNIPIHASTQMAVHNSPGAAMAGRLGFARVVLARELTLPEIAAAASAAAENGAATEVFVHGALCYSLSGHCLFSSWIGGMSANRGLCRQPCRRAYAADGEAGYRPLFNLRDLELARHLAALKKAGVASLKVEGRMKPAEYVSTVAQAYRLALQAIQSAVPQQTKILLENDYAREKTSFFIGGNISNAITDRSFTGKLLGRVQKKTPRGFTLRLEAAVTKESRLRIQSSSGEDSSVIKIHAIRHADAAAAAGEEETDKAEAGQEVEIILPPDSRQELQDVYAGDTVLIAGTKELRFPSRIKDAGAVFPKRMQHIHREIFADLDKAKSDPDFPDELFMRIDRLSWLAKLQMEKISALILNLTLSDWEDFDVSRPGVMRNIDRFVIQLPLFIPEKRISNWLKIITRLRKAGCRRFMAAQLWQLPLLDGADDSEIWAAETVYTLNDAAAAYLDSFGFERRILPLENDMENLYAARERRGVVPLYARPKLFVSRVPALVSGTLCRDRTGEYRADVRDGILELTPALPLCWFQYLDDLESMGYRRFLIDLSSEKPSQNTFWRLLKHFEEGKAVQPSSPFNFKNGLT